jgi:uncharacterized membrane protein YheB (UPF0754 family)
MQSIKKIAIFNLSFMSNAASLLLIALGFGIKNSHIASIGSYAFSGAITNWLAIYMLFERVPFIYGSGVVVLRFEVFKASIKSLVMDQFFNDEQIKTFFSQTVEAESKQLDLSPLMDAIDYDLIFNRLVEAILASSLGGMLSMFGGVKALDSLKEPCSEKIREVLLELVQTPAFHQVLMSEIAQFDPDTVKSKVALMVDKRLDELTPQMVKELVKDLIHKHLGWLVLWGAVFGGVIGGVLSFVS